MHRVTPGWQLPPPSDRLAIWTYHDVPLEMADCDAGSFLKNHDCDNVWGVVGSVYPKVELKCDLQHRSAIRDAQFRWHVESTQPLRLATVQLRQITHQNAVTILNGVSIFLLCYQQTSKKGFIMNLVLETVSNRPQ